MVVSAAAMYKLVTIRSTSKVGRLSGLAGSFAFMGTMFTPELFNPFLIRQ